MINVWGGTEILPLIIFLNIRLNHNVWFTYQRVDPTAVHNVLRKKIVLPESGFNKFHHSCVQRKIFSRKKN